jgi:hypothetical protein
MLSEKMLFELDSNNDIIKCVAYAPSSSPVYSRLAVATQFCVYIYAVIYEKSQITSKYHLNQKPALIGKISDDEFSSFEIVSILWNNQGSAISVQYNDGTIRIYQRKYLQDLTKFSIFRDIQFLLE